MPTDSAADHERDRNFDFQLHSVEVDSDLELFDSEYLKRFAQTPRGPEIVDVLVSYVKDRFKLLARHLIHRLSSTGPSSDVDRDYGEPLKSLRQSTLELFDKLAGKISPVERAELRSRLGLELASELQHQLGLLKRRRLADANAGGRSASRVDLTPHTSSEAESELPKITKTYANAYTSHFGRKEDASPAGARAETLRWLEPVAESAQVPKPDNKDAAATGAEGTKSADTEAACRRAMVDAYIEEVRSKTGKRISRTDIWTSARYKSRTEFERWERNDTKRPNKSAHQCFTGILAEKPHLK